VTTADPVEDPVVLVDAENVRRSKWPNVSRDRLVELCDAWAESNGRELVVVFDGPPPATAPSDRVRLVGAAPGETADEWLVREARALSERVERFWLVTSDRELRDLAGPYAQRTIGGGSFLRELLGDR
jgi:predicted RNA-binding protein with PIN domain